MSDTASLPRPAPHPSRVSAFFWEGVDEEELRVQRCMQCERVRFPPRPMCPSCNSVSFEVVALSGKGRVYAYIVPVHPRLPMFEPGTIVALIDLEDGVRLVSNLCEIDPEEITADMPVEVFFIDLGDGRKLHQFRPLRDKNDG